MGSIRNNVESGGNIRNRAEEDRISFSGGSGEISEKDLGHEFEEDGQARMEFISMLNKLTQEINLKENYDILEMAIGEFGAVDKLTKEVEMIKKGIDWRNIAPNSSAVDKIRNAQTTMMLAIEWIKKRNIKREQITQEEFKQHALIANEEFIKLTTFLERMVSDSKFSSVVTRSRRGYIEKKEKSETTAGAGA